MSCFNLTLQLSDIVRTHIRVGGGKVVKWHFLHQACGSMYASFQVMIKTSCLNFVVVVVLRFFNWFCRKFCMNLSDFVQQLITTSETIDYYS